MADNFGLKIGVEGEKEFKKALAEINQTFKVLGSEMNLVASQFDKQDKSVEALSARNRVLNQEIDTQRQKISTLQQALENATNSFGENDRRTKQWQTQLNNAQAALNDMERELAQNERAIDELGDELEQSGNQADDFGNELEGAADDADNASSKFDKVGSVVKGMGVAIGAAVVAAGAALAGLTKSFLDLAESTREYREDQAKLDAAFITAGFTTDQAGEAYKSFYSILGEEDRSVEAVNHLAQLCSTEEELTRWTDKDGMTFASINGGKDYVEDFSYTTEVRISTLDCSNFTNPYQMLEYTQMRLAEYAQPRVSYVLSAMDLSALTGYEHEAWALGDIVTVDDKDLNLSVKTRVVRRQYNLQEPWKTVLELSTTLRELGDSSAQWDKAADVLASTDVIDRQEVKDLVPFNHLRNSRADSGMNYWTNSGFEVDAENGVSGTASFKAEGVLGMTKSLTQTVYPASRRSYTFSAQIASEDLQKGPSGQVGIEVTFEYEDGSTEMRFIDLF